ncbi:uncharacterized protein LOC143206905 [Rhynchophorus ferrugineus]|uniref:Uncharacterized protein n=1 Tax=Rhynchophorus ferrugineus TaxID=354439 RepID=A0A834HVS9_RHYFE|nr:hypothetical protein GWI33_020870 [Rhynchophorus ferrugineus]
MVKVKGVKKIIPSSKTGNPVKAADKDKLKKRKQIVDQHKCWDIVNGTDDGQDKTASRLIKIKKNNKKEVDSKKFSKTESLVRPEISNGLDATIKKQRKRSDPILLKKIKPLKKQSKNSDARNDKSKTNVKTKHKKPDVKSSNTSLEDMNSVLEFNKFEKKFNIKVADIESAVKGVLKIVSNNPKLKNELFDEERPVFLQVNSVKIPHIKGKVKTVFRIPLINSILPPNADICLIVPDVKGIKNNEHEQHVEHYETLLKNKGVTGIKKIMTFHELRTEYDTFELKKRLVDLYDIFLVDGRISGQVVRKCGSIFYNKRKLPVPTKLQATNLKSQIENALKKVFFQMSFKGDSHMVQFGHSKMPLKALIENVYSVVEFLSNNFPGKMQNIRSLYVNVHRGTSIPIYLSMTNPNEISVPTLKNKINKNITSVSGELTTQYDAYVTVKPDGVVVVKRTNKKLGENKEEDSIGETTTELVCQNNNKSQKNKRKNGEVQPTSIVSKKRKTAVVEKIEKNKKEKPVKVKILKAKKNSIKNEESRNNSIQSLVKIDAKKMKTKYKKSVN